MRCGFPIMLSSPPRAARSRKIRHFCTGLVLAAEAVLQVAERAGTVQVTQARRAAAHGCHGFAQQGNVVAVFERV